MAYATAQASKGQQHKPGPWRQLKNLRWHKLGQWHYLKEISCEEGQALAEDSWFQDTLYGQLAARMWAMSNQLAPCSMSIFRVNGHKKSWPALASFNILLQVHPTLLSLGTIKYIHPVGLPFPQSRCSGFLIETAEFVGRPQEVCSIESVFKVQEVEAHIGIHVCMYVCRKERFVPARGRKDWSI